MDYTLGGRGIDEFDTHPPDHVDLNNASEPRPSMDDRSIAASSKRALETRLESVTQMDSESRDHFIWGTNLATKQVFSDFHRFITQFEKRGSNSKYYLDYLYMMRETEVYILDVDYMDLVSFDCQLARNLISYPQELIPIIDAVILQIYNSIRSEDEGCARGGEVGYIEVRPFNLGKIHSIRELNPENIDQLISIQGMILRISKIIPDLRLAMFQCGLCKSCVFKHIQRGKIEEPTRCHYCQARKMMNLIHNRCYFSDKQMVKLQEVPDNVPEGSTPQTSILAVHDSLVDIFNPGDRVIITGIFRTHPIRRVARERKILQIYKIYFDVVHFQRIEKGKIKNRCIDDEDECDIDGIHDRSFLERYKDEFETLARRDDICQILVNSMAPSIWQMEDVKLGILCLLFGGTKKKYIHSTCKNRSEINILLCGDPGTSKSQLLQYVHKLSPRGIFTSGKGSSAVGLTAYVCKDPDTGEMVLESGALTLSDRGVCCIDEFDKMNNSTRSILHEAMEQQTISIAKAGIIATLNARTSILASANPRGSRYNTKLSVVDNIQLPPTLLSRFDLIYLILDRPNREYDAKLARHIISLYFEPGHSNSAENSSEHDSIISTEKLAHYISYAKMTCKPVISNEAADELTRGYIEMRKDGITQNTITATTRQLESLIRLSEAFAKMRLSPIVTSQDVKESIRLMKVATYRAATDPLTGKLDMDLINTGRGSAHEKNLRSLVDKISDMIKQTPTDSIPQEVFWNKLMSCLPRDIQKSIKFQDFIECLHMLEDDSLIVLSGTEKSRIIRIL